MMLRVAIERALHDFRVNAYLAFEGQTLRAGTAATRRAVFRWRSDSPAPLAAALRELRAGADPKSLRAPRFGSICFSSGRAGRKQRHVPGLKALLSEALAAWEGTGPAIELDRIRAALGR